MISSSKYRDWMLLASSCHNQYNCASFSFVYVHCAYMHECVWLQFRTDRMVQLCAKFMYIRTLFWTHYRVFVFGCLFDFVTMRNTLHSIFDKCTILNRTISTYLFIQSGFGIWNTYEYESTFIIFFLIYHVRKPKIWIESQQYSRRWEYT